MNAKGLPSEKGQALVLIVLGVVALLGFTALAVDGSMLYSDRRFSQNSADASSLAGGAAASQWIIDHNVTKYNWSCGSLGGAFSAAKTASINRAANNGFVISQFGSETDLPDPKMGVYTKCNNGSGPGEKYIDITTWISHDTDTAFAHFVFKGLLRNTVHAVTRVRPPENLAFGYAIVALNDQECTGQKGVGFAGTSDVLVNGGGVFSNGCFRTDGAYSTIVHNADVRYNELKHPSDDDNVVLDPDHTIEQTSEQIPASAYQVETPDCSAAQYTGNWPPPNVENMSPGLYCITNNINVNAADTVWGEQVTIYVINGSVSVNGQANVHLTAPPQTPDPWPAIGGLVLYLPPSNDSAVNINGGSNSYWVGTILAPSSDVSMEGNEDATFIGQIIGWNVTVSGTGDSGVVYDNNVVAMKPTLLDLLR